MLVSTRGQCVSSVLWALASSLAVGKQGVVSARQNIQQVINIMAAL